MKCALKTRRYRLCPIAQTGHFFSGFAPFVPCINNAGLVGFQASLKKGGAGIFFMKGSSLTPVDVISDLSDRSFCSHPDMNTRGVACFYAQSGTGTQAVLRVDHGHSLVITDTTSLAFTAIGPLGPTISEAGAVAFRATEASGLDGIYSNAPGGPVRRLANTGGPFCRFHGLPVINNGGTVLFRADLVNGGQGIFAERNGALVKFVDTESEFAELGRFPTINDRGAVAFVGRLKHGQGGLFVAEDERIVTLVDSASGFQDFRGALLDNEDRVVFFATPVGGQLGIFSGPDPAKDKILGVGDQLSGSRITEFALNPVSINATGQLAIRVSLQDGRQMILQAEIES